jgi:hypothetical protein
MHASGSHLRLLSPINNKRKSIFLWPVLQMIQLAMVGDSFAAGELFTQSLDVKQIFNVNFDLGQRSAV